VLKGRGARQRWLEEGGGALEDVEGVELAALLDDGGGAGAGGAGGAGGGTPAAAPDTAAALFESSYQPSWAGVGDGGGAPHARCREQCAAALALIKERRGEARLAPAEPWLGELEAFLKVRRPRRVAGSGWSASSLSPSLCLLDALSRSRPRSRPSFLALSLSPSPLSLLPPHDFCLFCTNYALFPHTPPRRPYTTPSISPPATASTAPRSASPSQCASRACSATPTSMRGRSKPRTLLPLPGAVLSNCMRPWSLPLS
jgi:hypothetical protein